MPTPPTAKLVEPGQARTIRLYGVLEILCPGGLERYFHGTWDV
jgi:hypothetical protein